jgi:hypothetical protein
VGGQVAMVTTTARRLSESTLHEWIGLTGQWAMNTYKYYLCVS